MGLTYFSVFYNKRSNYKKITWVWESRGYREAKIRPPVFQDSPNPKAGVPGFPPQDQVAPMSKEEQSESREPEFHSWALLLFWLCGHKQQPLCTTVLPSVQGTHWRRNMHPSKEHGGTLPAPQPKDGAGVLGVC